VCLAGLQEAEIKSGQHFTVDLKKPICTRSPTPSRKVGYMDRRQSAVAVCVAAVCACLLAELPALRAQQGAFQLACSTLPFEIIKKDRAIDNLCDRAGDATTIANQAQNRAKNEFCAAGSRIHTTFFTFRQLQAKTEAARITGVPANRTPLQGLHTTSDGDTIGEGSVVQLIGFLIKGKFSNVGSGESVNCDLHDREENDIHLNLVQNKPPANPTDAQIRDLECQSVVMEISPHFRPEPWEILGSLNKTSANATAAKKIAALDLRRPMRFTGHAFYDGFHKPCVGMTPGGSSRRTSAWEIHPIYAIEVCVNTSLSGCPRTDGSRWRPLDVWLTSEEDDS